MGAQRGLTDAALDRASPVPLYYQLAESLETAIRSGSLSSGSHLENEIELARQLRVSRPTVRRAIAVLANRGLVIRRHGIGTLVVPDRVLRLASQSIGARSPEPREARLLKVIKNAPLLTMRRISYGDAGQPVEYGSHVYPAERYSFEMSVVADSRT